MSLVTQVGVTLAEITLVFTRIEKKDALEVRIYVLNLCIRYFKTSYSIE